jgi:hypothetical protein
LFTKFVHLHTYYMTARQNALRVHVPPIFAPDLQLKLSTILMVCPPSNPLQCPLLPCSLASFFSLQDLGCTLTPLPNSHIVVLPNHTLVKPAPALSSEFLLSLEKYSTHPDACLVTHDWVLACAAARRLGSVDGYEITVQTETDWGAAFVQASWVKGGAEVMITTTDLTPTKPTIVLPPRRSRRHSTASGESSSEGDSASATGSFGLITPSDRPQSAKTASGGEQVAPRKSTMITLSLRRSTASTPVSPAQVAPSSGPIRRPEQRQRFGRLPGTEEQRAEALAKLVGLLNERLESGNVPNGIKPLLAEWDITVSTCMAGRKGIVSMTGPPPTRLQVVERVRQERAKVEHRGTAAQELQEVESAMDEHICYVVLDLVVPVEMFFYACMDLFRILGGQVGGWGNRGAGAPVEDLFRRAK